MGGALVAHGQAAADAEHLAGDVIGLGGGKERDHCSDFLRLGKSAKGNRAEQRGLLILRNVLQQGGIGRSGGNAVDSHAMASHCERKRFGLSLIHI